MRWTKNLLLVLLVCADAGLVCGQQTRENESPKDASYFRDIWPIVQRRCQGCHQPSVKQGNLDLTQYEGFRIGGKSGPAFLPGEPDKSLVYSLIAGKREPRMPLGQ